MSCEDVCLGDSDNGSYNEWYTSKVLMARVAHKCCECGSPIGPKQEYERVALGYDGDVYSYKTCMVCVEIRDAFYCGSGWLFENVWEDIRDYLFDGGEFSTGCLSKLETVAAKSKVMTEWRRWKGLAA